MRVFVVTPPQAVITTDEAKAHLKVLEDDEDALIDSFVAAATAHLDGPSGWLGRAIGLQTLEARFDSFECGALSLPFPPLAELISVKYLDNAAVEQTVDLALCEMMGQLLVPVDGQTWPSPLRRREAVRIRYQAGYQVVPAPIRAAILLMVGDLYANRETTIGSSNSVEVPMSTTVENLLGLYRVWA
jgi:uncharacterized phiE125 gp8 family phage protein